MTKDAKEMPKFIWESKLTSLRKWRVGTFKSVNKGIEIELAPLTIVVGANSSGKSTLIQSILLLAQNASRADEKNSAKARGLFELNGPLVQLGTFRETACDLVETKTPTLEFGGNWCAGDRTIGAMGRQGFGHVGEQTLAWDISLRPLEKNLDSGVALLDNSTVKYLRKEELLGSGEVIFKDSKSHTDLLRSKYENFSFKHNALLENRNIAGEKRAKPKQKIQAVSFQAGLPFSGLISKNIVEYMFENQNRLFNASMFMDDPEDPFPDPNEIPVIKFENIEQLIEEYVEDLADLGRRILQQDRSSEDRSVSFLGQKIENFLVIPLERFPDSIRRLLGNSNPEFSEPKEVEASEAFTDKFLKSLRTRFDALYGDAEWAQESTFCLPNGKRSINTPRHQTDRLQRAIGSWNRYLVEDVLYLGPLRVGPRATYGIGASVENSNIPLGESGEFLAKKMFTDDTPRAYPIVENGKIKDSRFTLEEAVTFWYRQLASTGDDNSISVDAPNRQGYPLKIGSRTLANVGFGASQILPVLGLCLSATPGDLILLEQPELHLNPGMQQKLADFLLVMAKTGRQIIVETHSEYLITRLRRNAATDPVDHKYFTIIFVERDVKTGTSYRTVNVDEQGDLSEWPKGFFDHVAEDLRILMRKAAERQAKRHSETVNTETTKDE
jgi:predicted ATPase